MDESITPAANIRRPCEYREYEFLRKSDEWSRGYSLLITGGKRVEFRRYQLPERKKPR